MPKSRYKNTIELTVQAADRGTEIFVVDSGLRRIASDVGALKQAVSPGIYKIRFRSGQSQIDKLIEVKPDVDSMKVEGPSVQFSSAAPIEQTSTNREYHKNAACELSLSPARERPGRGSGLFVFVRDLLPNAVSEPWEGLSIHQIDGKFVAKLSDGVCNAKKQYGGLNLEVDPGIYRIRVDTGQIGTFEMFAVTAVGWQTQYFAMTDDFPAAEAQVRRASLRSSTIMMAPQGTGYNPLSEYNRLAEIFRIALQSGRNVLTANEMIRLLKEKCENPMLLIFGAHLLVRLRPINHPLLNEVIRNLEQRFAFHPDVKSLLLRPGAGTPAPDLAFPEPPMLRSSWDLIVRGSRRRMRLVPPGSVADSVADGLLTTTPWLLHRLDDTDQDHPRAASLSEVRQSLEKLVEMGEGKTTPKTRDGTLGDIEQLNPLEQKLLNATVLRPTFFREAGKKDAKSGLSPSVSQVLREIDAPYYAIARSVVSLVKKLGIDFEK